MGKKVIGHTLPAEDFCGDTMIDMCPEKSVLLLIKHCREMKQQETRLRLVTLFLLLSCTTLFIFNICADVKQHKNSGSSGQGSAVEHSPAFPTQGGVYPAHTSQTNFQGLHIHLRSESLYNKTDGMYITWNVRFGENYSKEKHAIVIPQNGFYFVYVRIALSCFNEDVDANFRRLFVALHNWSDAYNKVVILLRARDGITCTSEGFRSVFVGQLFDLLKGDHVSVWIGEGHELIIEAEFGAYLT